MGGLPRMHLRKDYRVTFCGRSVQLVNFSASFEGITCLFCNKEHNSILEEYGEIEYYRGAPKVKNDGVERQCNRDDCRKMFFAKNKFTRNCGCSLKKETQYDWNER